MELFQHASDDAIALACCGGALLLSGSIMFFSKYLNPVAQQVLRQADRPQLRLARPDFSEHSPSQQEKAA